MYPFSFFYLDHSLPASLSISLCFCFHFSQLSMPTLPSNPVFVLTPLGSLVSVFAVSAKYLLNLHSKEWASHLMIQPGSGLRLRFRCPGFSRPMKQSPDSLSVSAGLIFALVRDRDYSIWLCFLPFSCVSTYRPRQRCK